MKDTITKLLTGFAAGVCVLLLLGAAATTTRYVGNFLGNVGSATNAAGTTMNALKASATNVAAGATIGAANGGSLTNASGISFNSLGAANYLSSTNTTTNTAGNLVLEGSSVFQSWHATGNSTAQKWWQWYVGADKFVLRRKTDGGATVLATPIIITNDSVVFDQGSIQVSTNTEASWPPAPYLPGAFAFVNSNGFPYMLLSTNGAGGGSATWTATNAFGW